MGAKLHTRAIFWYSQLTHTNKASPLISLADTLSVLNPRSQERNWKAFHYLLERRVENGKHRKTS